MTWLRAWAVPNSKVYGANMGPTWGRQDPGGPHVGPMYFATGVIFIQLSPNIPVPESERTWHNAECTVNDRMVYNLRRDRFIGVQVE